MLEGCKNYEAFISRIVQNLQFWAFNTPNMMVKLCTEESIVKFRSTPVTPPQISPKIADQCNAELRHKTCLTCWAKTNISE